MNTEQLYQDASQINKALQVIKAKNYFKIRI
jgi:hypothetical protein